MLEIIILIFLTREIGRLAHSKGLKPGTWKIYTVVCWIISEIIGLIIGFMIFGKDNLFSVAMIGITFASTSYFIIKAQLNKLPDYFDDDIDRIGKN
jgi:TM2 domain-containing membrane protein YozV